MRRYNTEVAVIRTSADGLALLATRHAEVVDARERVRIACGAVLAAGLVLTAACGREHALAILGLQAVLAGRDTLLCTHSWYTCDSPRTAGRQQDTHAAKSVKAKQTKQADRHFEVFERGSATA